jgi:hypothetical protein
MIAGRVKVVQTPLDEPGKDPVSQIDFVVFYPGQAVVAGGNATPTLSLFSAQHASGHIERTRVMGGFASSSYRPGGTFQKQSDQAFLYLPMATCSTRRQDDGVDLTLSFLGLGSTEDYYLELQCGKVDRGRLMVEGKSGRLADYDIEFTEVDDSGEEVRNIMIAGFDPQETDDYTWLKIGTSPIDSKLNLTKNNNSGWVSVRMASFKPLIEQKEREWQMVQWDTPTDERLADSPDETPRAEEPRDRHEAIHHELHQGEPWAGPVKTAPSGSREQAAAPFPARGDGDLTEADIEDDGDYQAQSWTNMILSRAIETWQTRTF